MKIRTLIITATVFILGLASCRKIEYVDTTTIDTILINVDSKDWIYSNFNNNNYFYATVDMPEITKSAFKTGVIKMYRTYNFGSSNESQIEMPCNIHHEEYVSSDNWAFYTETLDYEFSSGSVTIYYTLSDFFYEEDITFIPEAMQFRCVIIH